MTLACNGMGIGTAAAIAVGPAHLLAHGPLEVPPRSIDKAEVEREVTRLMQAIDTASRELKAVRDQIPSSTPEQIAAFIDTHLLMLEDAALAEAVLTLIREQLCGAEWALELHRDALARVFEEMDDPYLRTRCNDVDHVVRQIQKILLGVERQHHTTPEELDGKVIIAHDLTPADTILLRHQGIAAFITEFGGPMSHTAILARSMGIPAVVGVRNVTRYLNPGELVVVDADKGVVLAGADPRTIAFYRGRIRAAEAHQASLRRLIRQPSVSRDGTPISLLANVEVPEDIETAHANGATGVGLYRTEFLYMNRDNLPDEEEHLAAYLDLIRGLDGIPITIRTLDLGVDKQVEGRSSPICPPACNPALGLRAIRLCLREPDLFRPQLRAILRASAYGPVRLMIPMLSNLQELRSVLQLIDETKRTLRREGLAFDPDLPVGGMIEVPAAALCADIFASYLDFLSIGTNDLIQYTLAIDRVDDSVTYLYDPLHPAVLRLIRMTIQAGQAQRVPVSMCGEMAGDPRYVRLLLGLGLRELSMQPRSLLEVKEIVRGAHVERLGREVEGLFQRLNTDDPGLLLIGINQMH